MYFNLLLCLIIISATLLIIPVKWEFRSSPILVSVSSLTKEMTPESSHDDYIDSQGNCSITNRWNHIIWLVHLFLLPSCSLMPFSLPSITVLYSLCIFIKIIKLIVLELLMPCSLQVSDNIITSNFTSKFSRCLYKIVNDVISKFHYNFNICFIFIKIFICYRVTIIFFK